ncbi:TPA: hypothetical protein DDW69_04120 [candidate division CPR2 bacterium]|uniref:Diacylglycerol kinase, catalytic region n=1 Tax=candidate division CPR2 bacterium GW2011_GWC1_41_48 TaxID=1618344 RepID=A0A0G0W8C6_UNCC2|nr:MAG: Diacylglycerol kinase, catalytic region [candidate division CPR2 bacterium GW2011_GWC2_39_35]KKR28435.1 MAG: Diacylglycerol kinase, catalytic region [candidate division CPR2 bacterium GW2011_GWD2_39_7]KKS09239.1 MAG: Diacylglycerol kinase, catalytic region [candidate division CPR2 bacterium GW2011_GWC1_41_48]OGB72664.1 MAG: hypothetical protein A2Y26_02180 [candidate division CPR2 bacterium GWD2_39_7]HBG81994.1 hypothetical protein [candidate division CPR2 bacterium]
MYYYIINPAAGNGKINKIQDKLKGILSEFGIAGEFVKSTGPGDIPKLTEIGVKKGYNTIVAIGGDGTVNEVLNNLNSESIAFGIVPVGKNNLLADSLGIAGWENACQILAARKTIKINIGKVVTSETTRYFINNVSLGLEASIRKDFPVSPKKATEKIKNRAFILKQISSYKSRPIKFSIDNNLSGEAQALNIKIANASLFGKSPSFRISFGENIARKEKVDFLKTADIKSLVRNKENTILYGDNLIIKTSGLPVSADDQFIGTSPIEVKIADRKARIIVGTVKAP